MVLQVKSKLPKTRIQRPSQWIFDSIVPEYLLCDLLLFFMPVLLISSQDVVEAVQPSNEDAQIAQDQEMSHMLRDGSGLSK